MALNFPNSPILDQVYTSDNNSWKWDGSSWNSYGPSLSPWVSNSSGIHTLSNVGIGTTIPTSKFYVVGDAIITGIITAPTFSGNVSGNATSASIATYSSIAGISTYTSEWILGANGTSDYTFTGPGFTVATNDPDLYLIRGQQYKFTNTMGMHPFRIQSTVNGSAGTQYNTGITNNDVSNGTLVWNVAFDTPEILYYQCTAHPSMGGKIYILNAFQNIANLNQITETVANAFNTTLSPSSGTLTIDTSLGTLVLGDLNASVTTWAFTNVPTANSKATTVTLIIDGDTTQTYGDACNVNGSVVSGGVKWSGGSAPTSTNNFDIITFTIVKDSAGTINVFGSGNTNFS